MSSVSAPDRGTRARTRAAILDAAASVLSRRPAASLGEVAEAAGVGRTTLHRYFPERADLIEALSTHLLEQIGEAVRRADLERGPARAALLRACRELFDLGDLLAVIFLGDPSLCERAEWQTDTEADAALLAAAARGHADRSIDPALTATWVQSLVWMVLYGAEAYVREHGGSRHAALDLALRSLDGALRPAD